jgi:hypothetical protein
LEQIKQMVFTGLIRIVGREAVVASYWEDEDIDSCGVVCACARPRRVGTLVSGVVGLGSQFNGGSGPFLLPD